MRRRPVLTFTPSALHHLCLIQLTFSHILRIPKRKAFQKKTDGNFSFGRCRTYLQIGPWAFEIGWFQVSGQSRGFVFERWRNVKLYGRGLDVRFRCGTDDERSCFAIPVETRKHVDGSNRFPTLVARHGARRRGEILVVGILFIGALQAILDENKTREVVTRTKCTVSERRNMK